MNRSGSGPTVVAGRYRLTELVGEGGMGAVWRATDELLGREVAVKRVRLTGLPPADAALARDRTMREARIAAALHHPHIVSIFDVVLEQGEPWLILEYLPSRSLGAILAEHRTLPPGDVAAIGAQVAAALAAAHEAGVVHRDVKPDNILVAPRPGPAGIGPLVKLTDFGISHAASAPVLTATEVLTGTPAYFAPETARGEGTDPRSDVYSLGASLYAAVEGHPPFGTDTGNVLALLARIGRGQVPPPRNAGHLTELLRGLTADDPAQRPTAAQAHHALLHAAAPHQGFAPAVMHAGRGERPRRRLRVVTAVVGVLAAVAAAVVTLTVGGDPTGGPAGTPTVTRPTAAAAAPPLRVEDPLTLDPCSLLDTASLRAHGDARVDRHDITFAACGADLTRPDGSLVMVTTQFRTASELVLPSGAARESLDGRGVYRLPVEPDGSCGRRIMLTESTAAEVWALPGGAGATDDLCAIAETGTRAAVATVADGVIGARPGMDTTTVLGGTDACGLLQPADLAIVPGMRQPVAGFGNWACSWSDDEPTPTEVHVTFYLGKPLGDSDGVPADFAGHPGRVLAGEGDCWVQFVQRDYTADSSPRIESVWVRVYGPRPGTELCGTATALATAAASRLPPPS